MPTKVLILNGPGLGDIERLNECYVPSITLATLETECSKTCKEYGFEMSFRQSDEDDEIFSIIANDAVDCDLLIINPICHYATDAANRLVLYRSAIKALARRGIPVVEVHMNNIFQKSENNISPLQEPGAQIGFICGLGIKSYSLAIESIALKQAS